MGASFAEKRKLEFLQKLDGLKRMTGKDDKELGKLIGCTPRTVGRMRKDPFSVTGKYLFMVEANYEKEKERRGIK